MLWQIQRIVHSVTLLLLACIEEFCQSTGLESTTVSIYIAEAAPNLIRGRLVAINVSMMSLGQVVASLTSTALSGSQSPFKVMYGLALIPALIQVMAFVLFMPESPRWLIRKKLPDEARAALKKCRGQDVDVEEELRIITAMVLENDSEAFVQDHFLKITRIMMSPSVRRALTIGCCLQMFQQLAGINTVMYYSNSIIRMAGVTSPASVSLLSNIMSVVNFIFTFVGLYLVEKIGRRPLTLFSLCGAVLSLTVLGLGFQLSSSSSPPVTMMEVEDINSPCAAYSSCASCVEDSDCGYCYMEHSLFGPRNASCLSTSRDDPFVALRGRCNNREALQTWAYDYCPNARAALPLLGFVLYMAFFAPGMGPMPWTINSEIYPQWARSTAYSLSTATNWFFTLLQSMTFLTMTETLTRQGTFWLYAVFSIVGVLLFYQFLPETKGKSLEEVEGLFAVPWFPGLGKNPINLGHNSAQYINVNGGLYSFDSEDNPNQDRV